MRAEQDGRKRDTRSAHFKLDPAKLGTPACSRLHIAAPAPGTALHRYENDWRRFA